MSETSHNLTLALNFAEMHAPTAQARELVAAARRELAVFEEIDKDHWRLLAIQRTATDFVRAQQARLTVDGEGAFHGEVVTTELVDLMRALDFSPVSKP